MLGGSSNSLLFQNVREKESLAYSIGSSYSRLKNVLFIRCGIEISNFDLAKELVSKQLEILQHGDFNEEQIADAKTYAISSIDSLLEDQISELNFYLNLDLQNINISINDYKNMLSAVTKEDIIDFANSIKLNTIYFLKD